MAPKEPLPREGIGAPARGDSDIVGTPGWLNGPVERGSAVGKPFMSAGGGGEIDWEVLVGTGLSEGASVCWDGIIFFFEGSPGPGIP